MISLFCLSIWNSLLCSLSQKRASPRAFLSTFCDHSQVWTALRSGQRIPEENNGECTTGLVVLPFFSSSFTHLLIFIVCSLQLAPPNSLSRAPSCISGRSRVDCAYFTLSRTRNPDVFRSHVLCLTSTAGPGRTLCLFCIIIFNTSFYHYR
jgi:hypothetical protein